MPQSGKPGAATRGLNRIARQTVIAHGFEAFPHQLGHGTGPVPRSAADPPPRERTDVLEVGMVFAVEPGVYIPGRGGVRMEEPLVVTETKEQVVLARSLPCGPPTRMVVAPLAAPSVQSGRHRMVSLTLAERTAQVIRERILGLAPGYEPGSRLYPNQVAADLGVSITPVREALKLLSVDGLIEFSPRRGTRVISLSQEELDDLVQVRAGLELLALRMCSWRLPPDDLRMLEMRLDDCQAAIDAGDMDRYLANDAEFHRLLIAAAKSPRLMSLYESICQQAQILDVYFARRWEDIRAAMGEHVELARQLGNGGIDELEALVERHWRRSRSRLQATYERYTSDA